MSQQVSSSPWAGPEHANLPSRRLHEKLGISSVNRTIIRCAVWFWVVVEAVVIFGPFVY